MAANGTLQPTRSVTIGSELSGTVRNVLVDVNDKVKKGQVLVELDTAKLEAQVLRSRASLAAAQARLAQAVATTKEATAGLARLQEVARLSGGKVPSATELDAGQATRERDLALGMFNNTAMLGTASQLYRLAIERAKPDAERNGRAGLAAGSGGWACTAPRPRAPRHTAKGVQRKRCGFMPAPPRAPAAGHPQQSGSGPASSLGPTA